MTERERLIVKRLLTLDYDEYISGAKLAKEMNISVKTIQKEIQVIRSLLQTYEIELISVTSKGYRLTAKDPLKLQTLKLNLVQSRNADPEYGMRYWVKEVLRFLIEQPDYITVQELADQCFVSKSKMAEVVKEVKMVLTRYECRLEHKPYYGIRLAGKEMNLRKLIMLEQIPIYQLNSADEDKNNLTRKLTDIIVKVLVQERYLISDVVLENLVLYTYLMVQRVHKENLVEKLSMIRGVISGHVLQMANTIAKEISEQVGEVLPYPEIEYLALQLQAERTFDSRQAISPETEKIVAEMLAYIRETLNIDLTNDIDLRISLALHIYPMILRAKHDFQLKNVMANEIKASFPLSYDIAVTGSCFLLTHYNVRLGSDEISYLAVYFNLSLANQVELQERKKVLVISSERRGNSLMLRHMILNQFRNRIEKLDFINVSEVNHCDLGRYDAVFTTALEYDNIPESVVRINYFLSHQDFRIIEKILDGHNEVKNFEDFFQKDLLLRGQVKTKEELLRQLIALAVKKYPNLQEVTLFQSIMRREKFGMTCFGNGIAIPHPDELIENSESFTVIGLLDNELDWNIDERVSIVFLICIKRDDSQSLKQLFNGLSMLLANENVKMKSYVANNLKI